MATKILDLKKSISLTHKRIEELEVQRKADIEEVKKAYITRFERRFPIALVSINLKYDILEFYYKGKEILSIDTCKSLLRLSTYLSMGGFDEERCEFDLERYIMIGRISEYTLTQYREIVTLLENYTRDKSKEESKINIEINKLNDFIHEYENKIFETKLDSVIDFYKNEKDFAFIPSYDRFIKVGKYLNRFDGIEMTNVSKSKKTMNIRFYSGDTFNVVGLSTRNKDFTEVIETLYDFSVRFINNKEENDA